MASSSIFNVIIGIFISLDLMFLIPAGIIGGVILAVFASNKTDPISKKKLKKYMWWSFFGPTGLLLFVLIIWGLISIILATFT